MLLGIHACWAYSCRSQGEPLMPAKQKPDALLQPHLLSLAGRFEGDAGRGDSRRTRFLFIDLMLCLRQPLHPQTPTDLQS